jgi:hypothetical protein
MEYGGLYAAISGLIFNTVRTSPFASVSSSYASRVRTRTFCLHTRGFNNVRYVFLHLSVDQYTKDLSQKIYYAELNHNHLSSEYLQPLPNPMVPNTQYHMHLLRKKLIYLLDAGRKTKTIRIPK